MNSDTSFLLGLKPTLADQLQDVLHLSNAEKKDVERLGLGDAILRAGHNRIYMHCTPTEEQMTAIHHQARGGCLMETLARRTVTSSGDDVLMEVVSTGNGPVLKADGCPMVPLTLTEAHRLLTRFSRADAKGEGLTATREPRVLAVWGEVV